MALKDLLEELFPDPRDRMVMEQVIQMEMSVGVEDYFASGGKVHTKRQCAATRKAGGPKGCAIHNPTPHRLSGSKRVLRATTLIEDICEHGVGHPDPDSAAYLDWRDGYEGKYGYFVHGCDGCCIETQNMEVK
jgi:hypothetical protein